MPSDRLDSHQSSDIRYFWHTERSSLPVCRGRVEPPGAPEDFVHGAARTRATFFMLPISFGVAQVLADSSVRQLRKRRMPIMPMHIEG